MRKMNCALSSNQKCLFMQIIINAPGHPNQQALRSFYQSQLSKLLGRYDFITTAKVFIQKVPSLGYQTFIELHPTYGSSIVAKGTDKIENKAFRQMIHRLKKQIGKHKIRRK